MSIELADGDDQHTHVATPLSCTAQPTQYAQHSTADLSTCASTQTTTKAQNLRKHTDKHKQRGQTNLLAQLLQGVSVDRLSLESLVEVKVQGAALQVKPRQWGCRGPSLDACLCQLGLDGLLVSICTGDVVHKALCVKVDLRDGGDVRKEVRA